jgi:hypothetical protein
LINGELSWAKEMDDVDKKSIGNISKGIVLLLTLDSKYRNLDFLSKRFKISPKNSKK